MRGAALQDALARTLGDPALVVAHRLPEQHGYVDENGERVLLPTAGGDRAVATLERDGHEVAALIYDAALDEDPELVEAVCAAATIALENEHLHRSHRRGSPSCKHRASGSSRPATPNGAGSSATCTTAHSSGWSRSPCNCA